MREREREREREGSARQQILLLSATKCIHFLLLLRLISLFCFYFSPPPSSRRNSAISPSQTLTSFLFFCSQKSQSDCCV
ncbi:hypothetical protein OIU78_018802 [Salix suchowensis]|nr:hypothetical protein OIU78_018802 [Salix suchowensis]